MTENEARAAGVKYGKGIFPWAASGRSLSLGRDEGMTKVLFDDVTGRVIGCGIVGSSAGDLIAEAVLAIEMGADAADIGLTIHAHPTLSETVAMAAEAFEGTDHRSVPAETDIVAGIVGCAHVLDAGLLRWLVSRLPGAKPRYATLAVLISIGVASLRS